MTHSKGSDTTGERRRAGRPEKLSLEQVALLRRVALEHPHASLDDLHRLFAKQAGVTLSNVSMYRYLAKAGIQRVARAKKSARTEAAVSSPPSASPQPITKPVYGYNEQHRDPGDATRYPACLTDAEWALVSDLFEAPGPGKPPKYSRRRMVNACCYVVRSGCPWRMLPKDFPPWQDVYAHFRRWTDKGLFERMHDRLRAMWRERAKRDVNPTAAIVDSQSVKTSPQGGPKGFDAGKKVKGRKRHLVVDTLGLLLAVLVHPANVQDRDGAAPVVQCAMQKYPSLKKLYVDNGYSGRCADNLRETHHLDVEVVRRPSAAGAWMDAQLALFTPPPRPFVILPKRWIIERTNSWVERPRRMAKDQDRRLDVAASWIWLTEARLLLRRVAIAVEPPTAMAA
jgi:transposase